MGVGSVDEAPAIAGASHFLEHLLFKGTEQRSARSIAEAVDAVGGDMNAFTTKEYTAFYLRVLAKGVGRRGHSGLNLALDVLSDIFWNPALREGELESERQVILEEILMHADEPSDLVHDVFAEGLFGGHPLGREVLGDAGTVTEMTRDQVMDFHRHHYRPVNVVVAAAGAVDHEELVAGIQERMGERSGGEPPARHVPSGAGRPSVVVNRPTEQAHVVVGVPGPGRDDDSRYALAILDQALGGGMSSRLFQTIREERGLAYSVYSFHQGFDGVGAVGVYAGTSPELATQVLELIHAELDKVAEEGLTKEEIERAKGHLLGSTMLSL
ncbi:MAG: M16 family metallopeptidase, partial [Candidatus Dormibacteria bacterium]